MDVKPDTPFAPGHHRKPPWQYWRMRAVTLGGLSVGVALFVASLVIVRSGSRDDWTVLAWLATWLLGIISSAVALFPGRTLAFFQFPYSAFGSRRATTRIGWTGIERFPGWRWADMPIDWTVFPDGLQIDIHGAGSVFLPVSAVVRCEVGRRTVDLVHDYKELRSPIQLPKTVFESFWRHCLSQQFPGESPFLAERRAG